MDDTLCDRQFQYHGWSVIQYIAKQRGWSLVIILHKIMLSILLLYKNRNDLHLQSYQTVIGKNNKI